MSDSTYDADHDDKIPLCVAARVPTWHVNIPSEQIEFYAAGADPKRPTRVFSKTETFEILGAPIQVADLFQDESEDSAAF